jgi:hypothetical protein
MADGRQAHYETRREQHRLRWMDTEATWQAADKTGYVCVGNGHWCDCKPLLYDHNNCQAAECHRRHYNPQEGTP